jgi:glucose/arabinose dehydrogenase
VGNTDAGCTTTEQPVSTFTAHSSADGLTFYEGNNFPPDYTDNAFVAIFGSYILPQIPRGVMRVQLTKTGNLYTAQSSWFLTLGTTGHPLDLTVGPDDGLYVADYEENAVYRIVYGAP